MIKQGLGYHFIVASFFDTKTARTVSNGREHKDPSTILPEIILCSKTVVESYQFRIAIFYNMTCKRLPFIDITGEERCSRTKCLLSCFIR